MVFGEVGLAMGPLGVFGECEWLVLITAGDVEVLQHVQEDEALRLMMVYEEVSWPKAKMLGDVGEVDVSSELKVKTDSGLLM